MGYLYTTKQLLGLGGLLHYNNLVEVTIGHTTNWYREVEPDKWENYACTSSY